MRFEASVFAKTLTCSGTQPIPSSEVRGLDQRFLVGQEAQELRGRSTRMGTSPQPCWDQNLVRDAFCNCLIDVGPAPDSAPKLGNRSVNARYRISCRTFRRKFPPRVGGSSSNSSGPETGSGIFNSRPANPRGATVTSPRMSRKRPAHRSIMNLVLLLARR